MKRHKKNRKRSAKASWMFRLAKALLLFFVAVALLAPIIANERPLYMMYKGHAFFPAFSFKTDYIIKDESKGITETLQLDITDWKQLDAETVIFPPVPYSAGKKDLLNADYLSPDAEELFQNNKNEIVEMPLKYRHWLGTNKRGEDVLAGLIYGTRISLLVGIISMMLASLIGLLLGSVAGYFGDYRLKTTLGRLLVFLFGIVIAWFYAFHLRSFILQDALASSGWKFLTEIFLSLLIAVVICFVFSILGKFAGKIPFLSKQLFIKADSTISRFIEVFISLPRLIIIISIAAIARPSIINLILIIGFTSWTGIARLIRAEMLRVRELDYIAACRAMGFREFRTMMRHALPNTLAPAIVAIAFGVSAAILVESGLSFLNIGVPPDIVTWGTMLAEGREYFNAWWLVLFPGLAIFLLVITFNFLGDSLRDHLDKRTQ
jgi:peptide/nickel transport system permease protein